MDAWIGEFRVGALDKTLRVRKATVASEDLKAVVDILIEAAHFVMAKGIKQWWVEEFGEDKVRGTVEAGLVYLACWDDDAATPVGTIALYPHEDALFWPEFGADEAVMYVHRLGIRRTLPCAPATSLAGVGLGAALLGWAEAHARTKLASRVLRLDCKADNDALRRFYDGQGYTRHSIVKLESGWQAQRFEKALVHVE